MPHLSPMNWLMAPMMFLLLLLPIFASALWWAQTPSMPLISSIKSSCSSTKWNWM